MKRMSLVVGLALACVIILGSGKADARQIPSGGPDRHPASRSPQRRGQRRRSHRLERKRRCGCHCGLYRSRKQPTPRIAHLRHDARSHPRCSECDRPSLSSLRLRSAGESGRFSGCRSGCGGTRCPGPAHRAIASRLTPPECIAAGIASVEADYTAALALIPDGPAKEQGIAVGQAAAAAILALRAADGAVGPFLNGNCPPAEYQSWRVPVHPGYPGDRL